MSVLQNRKLPSDRLPPLKSPLWSGPCGNGFNGGVSQSMLQRYLECRERFRLYTMEGLKAVDSFNHRIFYGELWHTCEQYYASGKKDGRITHSSPTWREKLQELAEATSKRYPLSQQEIEHWWSVCEVQFPVYVDHWLKHPESTMFKPLMREKVFDVPYVLPSKRVVRLRGKWDGVDLLSSEGKVFLYEHKTKGDINEALVQRQMDFDLQTMTYLVALARKDHSYPLAGLRYNCVRRPLSGGKHTITRHKAKKSNPEGESREAFYGRLQGLIKENPEHFFMRWRVDIFPVEMSRFEVECLVPLLENLCDDYEWWANCYRCKGSVFNNKVRDGVFPKHRYRQVRTPFGIWSNLQQGRPTELDQYLRNGSTVGLERATTLFPELTNA